MLPLPRLSRTSALLATLAIALVGIVAGAVRLLPWLLDPAVPWRVAAPFARGLATVALEAALAVGWPVGWALACFRFVERGEARVLSTLGESPAATVGRLAPQGAVFALVLGGVALAYGSDASAPGRVATELIAQARTACARAAAPKTFGIPFTGMTWLCMPGQDPRLAGSPPALLSGAVLTARSARIAGDFRAVQLQDAQVLLPAKGTGPSSTVLVRAATLDIHGMAPWASASSLPAWWRAVVLALTAWAGSSVAAYAVLRRAARHSIEALGLGAVGPLVALGLLRWLERADVRVGAFVLVPLAATAACALAALALTRLQSLRGRWRAASK